MWIAADLRSLFVPAPDDLPYSDDIERSIRRLLLVVLASFMVVVCVAYALTLAVGGRTGLATALAMGALSAGACLYWCGVSGDSDRPLRTLCLVNLVLLGSFALAQGPELPSAAWWLAVVPFIFAAGGYFRLAAGALSVFVAIVVTLFVAPAWVSEVVPQDHVVEPWRHFIAVVGSQGLALMLILLGARRRNRNADALAKARASATQATEAQARFLATMSHEIRTPLTGIVGCAELLESPQLSPTQRTQLMRMQRQSTTALLELVNDVLDLARLDAGKVALEHRPFSLRSVVFDANELFAVQAFGKSIELSSSCAADVPNTFIGDQHRVRQIVNNLVGNAVKFTDRGGVHIHLSTDVPEAHADDARCWVRIEVADSGPGIAEDRHAGLFSRFGQADTTIARRFGGTGLGLSITQELARLMGGRIELRSKVGEGSRFTLVVPLPVQGGEPRLARPTRRRDIAVVTTNGGLQRHLRSLLHELHVEPLTYHALPSGADLAPCSLLLVDATLLADGGGAADWVAATQRAGRQVVLLTPLNAKPIDGLPALHHLYKPVRRRALEAIVAGEAVAESPAAAEPVRGEVTARVLVVDDSPVNQVIVQAMLAQLGATCVAAEDGRKALQCIADEYFDAVLMDIHMPGMDGLETTREIRAREFGLPGRRVPVIAISGSAEVSARQRCVDAGMDDMLPKPFDLAQLRRCLSDWTQTPA